MSNLPRREFFTMVETYQSVCTAMGALYLSDIFGVPVFWDDDWKKYRVLIFENNEDG